MVWSALGCIFFCPVHRPKGMAWGLFTKMGFKAACEFPFYTYGVSAEELEK
jgi:hypothetical protein